MAAELTTVEWRSDHPLDLSLATGRFTRWGADRANVVAGGAYFRVAGDGDPYRARQLPDGSVEIATAGDPEQALADLRHRLAEGLPRDPVLRLAADDGRVAELVERYLGYRPPLVVDPFEALVTAISAQQINLAFATTVRSRLIERYGTRRSLAGVEVWEFPRAEALADANPAALRELQFTTRKSHYIVGVAQAAAAGELNGLDLLSNDEVISHLTQLRGIGPWSAEWLLARCLGRPEAVAASDLGVRKAVGFHYLGLERAATESEVREAAAGWAKAANWTAHLLLQDLM